jgi:[protein-PII] uridylyltransferase
MEILSGGRVYETLREMNDTGVLGRFMPEFGALRALVVHEPYHMYTVDEHTLLAIRNLEMLRTTTVRGLDHLKQLILGMGRLDVLFLSLLLHDIGKAAGRHHEEEGYKRIKSIMERLNMPQERRKRIEFLVRNHVLMSRIAMTRETDDSAVIAGFADAVGDIENLRAIYLITYADMSAVNPAFWSPWKSSLLKDLYERTAAYLSGLKESGAMHDPAAIFPGQDEMQQAFRLFIPVMPERYLTSATSDMIREDFLLYRRAVTSGAAVSVRTMSDGMAEITVCASDSPGLFARVAGFLSMKKLNIVHGKIYTGKTGIVIDKISLSNWKEIWWKGLEDDIVSGLENVLISNKSIRPTGISGEGHGIFGSFAEIDNETSGTYTLIEIFSPDRMGLLYDISLMLYEKGIDIVSARINTEGGLAQDIFAVTERDRKLEDETVAGTIAELWKILTS